jgi:multiple sugar transport system substrate-binding protein
MPGWRKTLAILTVLSMVALAAVFASLASAHSTTTKSGTLNIMGFGSGDDVAATRYAIAAKAVAGDTINNPNGGFNDQQFLAAIAGGNAPDLVYMDRNDVGTYAAKGVLMPLSSCVSSQKIDLSQYRKSAISQVTYKGALYGIPEFENARTIMVNDYVAKKAGVKVSDISTTDWAKLSQVAKKMSVVSGGKVTRIGFDPKLPEFLPLWAKANGQDLLSKDGLHAYLNSPKAVQALTYAMSLINEQGGWNAFSAFRNTFDFFGAGNQYAKNQLGAFPIEDWYYNVIAQTSPQVQLTAVPFTNRKGGPINYQGGSTWVIPKAAKNPTDACKFAKTMTSVSTWLAAAKERAAKVAKANQPFTGLFTANAVADQAIYTQVFKPVKKWTQWANTYKTLLNVQRYSFNVPVSPAGEEVQTAWTNAVNRVLQGQQSPQQALDQAQKEAQAAINAAS